MFKTFGLQVRRDGLDHAGYVRHWLGVHAPMCEGVAALRGYVANEVIRAGDALAVARTHPQFGATLDGIAQLHVDTQDGLARLAEPPEVQRWFEDGPNFVGQRTGFLTAEQVVRSPDRAGRPIKAIGFVHGDATRLEAVIRALAGQEPGGLVYSTVDTVTGSTNLPGFEVPDITGAVELWAVDEAEAEAALVRLATALNDAGTLVGAVVTREHVIRMPPQ